MPIVRIVVVVLGDSMTLFLYGDHLFNKWICHKCYNEFEYENKLPE